MTEQQRQISKETILSGYDHDNVIDWIKELRYFSFYKGFLNPYLMDGDGFVCHLKYTDKEDLLKTIRILGIRYRFLKDSEHRVIKGEPYPKNVFNRLPKTTNEFTDIEEIPNNRINGIKCNITIPKGYISISLKKKQHEKEYWLTNREQFDKATMIEDFILKKGLEDKVTKDFQTYIGYVDKHKLGLIL